MKILMMVYLFPPAGIGGAERQCFRQAKALAQRGHQVSILTPWWIGRCPRHEVIDGVEIIRTGWLLPLTWRARKWHDRLKPPPAEADAPSASSDSAVRQKRFRWMALPERMGRLSFMAEVALAVKTGRLHADVVHVHESHWLAGFAHWVAESLRVPVFCKEASAPVLRWVGGKDVPFAECWRRRRDKCRFIAITQNIARLLGEAGLPGHRIYQIANGMELPPRMANPEQGTCGLYVGNFSQGAWFKAFDVLIRAFGQAVREEPGMRFRLYGRGDTSGWEQFAREQGCAAQMDFAGETDDVLAALIQGGYFVLPSRVEGLSNALLEAMATGLPVVVSDIPANTEAVRDGVEGIVVPVEDVNSLARAMLRLFRNPGLRMRMGSAARCRIEEVFDIGKIAERLELAFRQAIEEEAGRESNRGMEQLVNGGTREFSSGQGIRGRS